MIWYLGSMLLVGLFWVIVLIGAHYNKEDSSTSVWVVEETPIREMVILTLIPPLFGILLLYAFYRRINE